MKFVGTINGENTYELNYFMEFAKLPKDVYGIFKNKIYRNGEVLGYVGEDKVIDWYGGKKKIFKEKEIEESFSEWDNLMKEIDEMRKMVDSII